MKRNPRSKARYSLSDFFSEWHACSRKDLNKAVVAAVTGNDRRAVLAMFRAWHPSTNFSHVAFKRLALSRPEPLTRGRINANVTEKRREIESLAYREWKPRPQRVDNHSIDQFVAAAADETVIPPMPPVTSEQDVIHPCLFYPRPKPYVPRKPKPKPEPKVQAQTTNEVANDEEEEWMEV